MPGKGRYPFRLAHAWASLDRNRAVALLKKTRAHPMHEDLVEMLLRSSDLTAADIENVFRGSRIDAFCHTLEPLLSANHSQPEISAVVAREVEPRLLRDLLYKKEASGERLVQYCQLLRLWFKNDSNRADEKLLGTVRSLLSTRPPIFDSTEIVFAYWKSIGSDRERVLKLLQDLPKPVRLFARAHWLAVTAQTFDEMENAFRRVRGECSGKPFVETYFLYTLVLYGHGEEAIALAERLGMSDEALRNLTCKWISLGNVRLSVESSDSPATHFTTPSCAWQDPTSRRPGLPAL